MLALLVVVTIGLFIVTATYFVKSALAASSGTTNGSSEGVVTSVRAVVVRIVLVVVLVAVLTPTHLVKRTSKISLPVYQQQVSKLFA